MTQIEMARQGTITSEMHHVARRESLDPELVRSRSGAGPDDHTGQHRSSFTRARADGHRQAWRRCKINANIGNSAVTSDIDNELSKLKMAVDLGSDTVMDLSTGGNIDAIRRAIIAASRVPVGTVPIYQAIQQVKKVEDLSATRHARHDRAPGQAGRRLHDGPRRHSARLYSAHRQSRHRHRLARRVAHGPVDVRPRPGESVLHAL